MSIKILCHGITVLPKLQPFTFGDEPSNVGDSITVQCTITSGDLPVKLSWRLNQLPLVSENGVSNAQFGRKVNVLTIDPISEEHAGNYTCLAENSAGSISHVAELVVNGIFNCSLFLFFRFSIINFYFNFMLPFPYSPYS